MNAQDRYDSLLEFHAQQQNLDWLLLKAQVAEESNFNPKATSPVGAQGLAQFMPATFAEWCPGGDPFNPEDSIRAQAAYMAHLLKQCDGDEAKALACYNWGIGHVQRAGDDWESQLPKETADYIQKITAYAKELRGGQS